MTHTFKHSWYMTLPYHVSPIIYSLNPKYLLTHTSRASSRIMTHYQWLIFMSHKYESSFTSQKSLKCFKIYTGHISLLFPIVQLIVTWRSCDHYDKSRDVIITSQRRIRWVIRVISLYPVQQTTFHLLNLLSYCWHCNQLVADVAINWRLKFVENLLQIHLCII